MPACTDSNEPNETSAAATSLSMDPVSDDDGSGGAFTGTAQGVDEDWFTYEGSDDIGNVVDPTVEVVGGAVEVCMYMDCVNPGPQTADCPNGTTADMDGELAGCCATSGFTVDLDCTGISDDANIYIRVKATSSGVCESYSMSYHY